ncbi:hypothetical protein AMTRI_Chr09g40180 [Amborella trichopoda]
MASVENPEPEVDMAASSEAPMEVAVVAEKPASKPVKEKKVKVPKEKKPKTTAADPPYFQGLFSYNFDNHSFSLDIFLIDQMIMEAILALKEKGWSSPYAIAKFMEEKHKAVLPGNFKKMLALQLKNHAAKGKRVKVKAFYKLVEEVKKEAPAKKPTKKPTQKKSAASAPKASSKPLKKKTTSVKKSPATKRAAPAKPKQPKSIKSVKSPVAKKARKVA